MRKVLLALSLLISTNLYAQVQFDGGFDTSDTPNCFALATFEFDLESQDAVKLCASSNPAPAFCYRFLINAKDLAFGKENTLLACSKAKSMMNRIDCVLDNIEEGKKSNDEIAKECSKVN